MKMENPEKEIILHDDEEKDDDIIDEGKVDCAGLW